MANISRLELPFQNGSVAIPEEGAIVALRAQPQTYSEFPSEQMICHQSFFPSAIRLQQQGLRTVSEIPESAALTVVHITRSKEESRALLSKAYDLLPVGGQLVVDGAKTDGIDSLLKAVKKAMPVDGQESKSHGKVFWLTKHQENNPIADWARPLVPAVNQDGFLTASGMFSADGIDPGSSELAPRVAGKLKGRGADLGAGWGWLSHMVLKSNPDITSLDLVEAESTALECAKTNVADSRAKFLWADATQLDQKRTHDFVIMNPPFHTGRKAEPALGRSFITSAAQMLKPSGQLYLVANKQLAYEATLNDCFSRWDVVDQTNRYKIIHARKPK